MVSPPCKPSGPHKTLISNKSSFEPRAAYVTQIRLLLRESGMKGEVWKLAVSKHIYWCCTHSLSVTGLYITAAGQQSSPCLSSSRQKRNQSMNRDCVSLNRMQPPWQESFNVIQPVLWQAPTRWPVTGRGKSGTKQINPAQSCCARTLQVKQQKRQQKCSAHSRCSLRLCWGPCSAVSLLHFFQLARG